MAILDADGHAVTGASRPALEHFERALREFQLGTGDPLARLAPALAETPGFVLARLFAAWLHLGGRDPAGTGRAAEVLAGLGQRPLAARERAHLAASSAALAGDYDGASAVLGALLREHPRDVLALQVAQSLDYVRGDTRALRTRVESVLPAWSAAMPGYDAVLATLAFGLEENGEYGRAMQAALHALALDLYNVRAHHVVVHVLEMQGKAREGVRWMRAREAYWAGAGPMATHNAWHLALFELEAEGAAQALATYDRLVAPGTQRVSGLIDASSLLWRLHLRGADPGRRWQELAARWAPHAADAYCAFNDLHATMAFVGAGRADLAQAVLAAQARRVLGRDTNSDMTRLVGLPACRALNAFGRGDYRTAERLLSRLPPVAHRLGGSQAQRDVLELTRAAAHRLARPRTPPGTMRAA